MLYIGSITEEVEKKTVKMQQKIFTSKNNIIKTV